jgi:D-alanyl-D-alanine carboxypeptidase/D-alanyl-D-alanine-endopeptidase (penicillin-binding protein 4)
VFDTTGPEPRRRHVARVLLIVGVLLALPGVTFAQSGRQQVAQQLATLLGAVPKGTHVGLVVADAASGERWFAQANDEPLKPASVLKLFVTAAALEYLGPDFRYETRVYLRNDELWVCGAGDPSLGDERIARRDGQSLLFPFEDWAEALRERGVRTLSRLVLDDGVFEHTWRHPDWPESQSDTWYQAPVGGLNFNDNCLDASVRLESGDVRLVLRPPLPASFYENGLTIGSRQRPLVRRAPDRDVFEFSGTVKRDGPLGPVSVYRPTVFFGHALREVLRQRGIDVQGPVVRRIFGPEAHDGTIRVATHVTPLSDVLWRANTFSQNLFAECLLKSLAAYGPDGQRNGQEGSWLTGVARMRTVLGKLGVDTTTAVFRDGSGLSHSNRVTADQVVELLLHMNRHRCREMFLTSLAQPGESGSMRTRYADPVLAGKLRAKTGSLSGVRALAGYVQREDGTTLVFAVLCNGPSDADLPLKVARILVK